MHLTAVDMKVAEGKVAVVEEMRGASSQGETLDDARENRRERNESCVAITCRRTDFQPDQTAEFTIGRAECPSYAGQVAVLLIRRRTATGSRELITRS